MDHRTIRNHELVGLLAKVALKKPEKGKKKQNFITTSSRNVALMTLHLGTPKFHSVRFEKLSKSKNILLSQMDKMAGLAQATRYQ